MFAVIFEVNPRPEAWDTYLGHAAILAAGVVAIEGFIDNQRYASLSRPGWLVSLSTWRDEKALIRWRTHALHHDIQGKGRSSVLADYHLRVGEIVTDTNAAEPLPQQRFDTHGGRPHESRHPDPTPARRQQVSRRPRCGLVRQHHPARQCVCIYARGTTCHRPRPALQAHPAATWSFASSATTACSPAPKRRNIFHRQCYSPIIPTR